jgi:hypothetical protein
MKTFYLLITNPLPSDSEILFFETLEQATAKQDELRAESDEDELGIELGETNFAKYYVAEFCEQFDQSRVTFHVRLSRAVLEWNTKANEWVRVLNAENRDELVRRSDRESWQSEDGATLYDECYNEDGSREVFCAFDQTYSTLRMGKVSYES